MTPRDSARRLWGRLVGRWRHLPVWYDPAYRLPLAALEAGAGIEPRRADLVAWTLLDERVVRARDLLVPPRARYGELARVHAAPYLESLDEAATLARIFAVEPSEVPVAEVLHSIRLAVGGTLEAARVALRRHGPTVNLLGGFHHAAPEHGGGLCAVNDVAVAAAVLRGEGFAGRIAVIDVDAHPPDGTAACMMSDKNAWIGSLSGSDWGKLPPGVVDLSVEDADDAAYLEALGRLLAELPRPDLAFVVAGGDVLAGDRFGRVRLTLDGARRRDLAIAAALDGVPSVWLPGGGYSPDAWKVLAGTVIALAGGPDPRRAVATRDPLAARFTAIARGLRPEQLGEDDALDADDLAAALGVGAPARPRLCGFYTAEGIEQALDRFGILGFLERLGYRDFKVTVESAPAGGERATVRAHADHSEYLLVDTTLEKTRIDDVPTLYVHWLALRNPRASFGPARPPLPGQEVPGLGLAREMSELYARIAERLGLGAIAFRPAAYHMAYTARHRFRFADPGRQGRFEAMLRDLAGVPLARATRLAMDGRILLDGNTYVWEADPMIWYLDGRTIDDPAVAEERARRRFTVAADEAKEPAQ